MSAENEVAQATPEVYLSPVVDDGQTRISTIPARPGKWSAVSLRWRRLTADQVSAIAARSIREGNGFCRHEAAEMAPRKDASGIQRSGNILDWDIKGADGQKLPVSADAICKLDPEFYGDLLAVVSGERPEWETPARGPEALPAAELKNLLRASGQ